MSKYRLSEIKVVLLLWIFLLVFTLGLALLYNAYSAKAILKIKSLDASPNTQAQLFQIEGDQLVRNLAGLINDPSDFSNPKAQQIFDKAYESYYKAIELAPWNLELYRNIVSLYEIKKDGFNQHYWLTLRAIEAKQFNEAKSELLKAEQIDSNNSDLKFLWGKYLLFQGKELLSQGKKSEANESFNKALEYFAETRNSGRLMSASIAYSGQCKSFLGQREEAIKDYKLALINNPNDDATLRLLVFFLFEQGEKEKAVKLLEVFLESESNYYKVNIRHILAKYYFDLGEHDKAIKQMEIAVKLNKNNPVLYNDLAKMYSDVGNTQRAMESWAKALEHSK
jgi:tetratricopeptide (TPR) repeat protein